MRRYSRLGAYWVSISAVCACLGCWRTRYLRWVTEWLSEWVCVSVLHLHHQQDVFIFYIQKKNGLRKSRSSLTRKHRATSCISKCFPPLTPSLSLLFRFLKSPHDKKDADKSQERVESSRGFYVTVQICYLPHKGYKKCNTSKRLKAYCVLNCNGIQDYNCL